MLTHVRKAQIERARARHLAAVTTHMTYVLLQRNLCAFTLRPEVARVASRAAPIPQAVEEPLHNTVRLDCVRRGSK